MDFWTFVETLQQGWDSYSGSPTQDQDWVHYPILNHNLHRAWPTVWGGLGLSLPTNIIPNPVCGVPGAYVYNQVRFFFSVNLLQVFWPGW